MNYFFSFIIWCKKTGAKLRLCKMQDREYFFFVFVVSLVAFLWFRLRYFKYESQFKFASVLSWDDIARINFIQRLSKETTTKVLRQIKWEAANDFSIQWCRVILLIHHCLSSASSFSFSFYCRNKVCVNNSRLAARCSMS